MYNQTHRLAFLLTGAFLLAAACFYSALSAGVQAADYPSWWTSGGVINTNATATNDFAAVNQGQVKWIAQKACEELAARLRGGAGSAVTNLIAAFSATNNYVGVNLGQLKYLAQPFYDRLILAGYTNAYPWTATDDVSHALANIGQIKNLFSFDLKDSDEDGMPDWWEIANGLVPTNAADGEADSDGDGISNALEYRRWTNPQDRQSANLTFYVDATNGSDFYDGLSPFWNDLHGPKRTIGNAITITIKGDIVEAVEGVYTSEPAIYQLSNKSLTLRPTGLVVVR